MNRRDFLLRASALTAGATVIGSSARLLAQTPPAPASPAPAAPVKTEFTPLRRNVGIFTGRGGTIGWLVNQDGIAVVDTQFPETAQAFVAGLPDRNGRMFDVVLNTHHHGDHTSGNPTLRSESRKIVAHANVPELLKLRAAQDKRELNPATVPTETFAETWRQEIGDEVVTARHFGPAHTRGDVVITFEKANVVHMGDLMFNRLYPVIDRPGGASIRAWIKLLEKVASDYPADAIYVFGHANPKFKVTGERAELLVLRDYLSGLLDYTQKQIAAGKSKEEIVALENLPGFPDFHQPLPNRLGINLSVAYDELTSAG